MSSMSQTTSGPRYWRSLDDLAQTPEFQEMVGREFPGEIWESIPPATRRQFLKVMGASIALAGLTACRWPAEEIVPFAHRPKGSDPGVPKQYATVMELGGAAQGLLVTSYDGRPIKVEGNPNHPDSLGAASAFAQAAILGIYDPDRSRSLVHRQQGQEFAKTWADFKAFAAEHFATYQKRRGRGLAVLAEPSSSPTLARLRARLLEAFPEAVWAEHTPCANTSEPEGVARLFGRRLRPVLHLDRARVVACFAADPIYDHPSALRHARGYAQARRPEAGEQMMRLYAAEPTYSLTGGIADERVAVAPSALPALILALVRELTSVHGLSLDGVDAATLSRAVPPAGSERFVRLLARDLAANRGRALLVAGAGAAAEVHVLVQALNAALGCVGTTVDYIADPDAESPAPESIAGLTRSLRAGQVSTLIILGGNPVYDAPADLGLAKLLDGVPTSIHLSGYKDETSRRCTWHVPAAHFLEAWGDARSWDGTLSVAQPLIEPLYDGRSAIELVATILGDDLANGYDLVRATMRGMAPAGAGFEQLWHDSLNNGVVAETASEPVRTSPRPAAVGAAIAAAAAPPAQAGQTGLELQLVPDRKVYDGRFANSGWLQELPDPITKVTWDNALLLSVADAGRLGVKTDDLVRVEAAGAHVELPAYVLPGQADGVATVSLGYGREAAGVVGDSVGANTYRLRTTAAPHVVMGARLTPTGRQHKLACTQDHHAIDAVGFEARVHRLPELVRETTLDSYLADPEVIQHEAHHAPLFSLWKERTYEGDQWGMAIDLNSCIGCNACVIACQAENNIPVVGREQVINGREMQWIRVDRYFRGEPETASMSFQPVPCMQCEDAPCEEVCPVAATQHTADGLNAMVYNRCVGTRYCSNNCPYKVRRFNFFNYHEHVSGVQKMMYNPDVTVRSRGVMEKCTYCIQRIEEARITAKKEGRPIRNGEIVTACQQTCPSQAIVFGNLNDSESEVAKLRENNRAYAMLAELNVRPRTHYLARLRNPGGPAAAENKETA